MKLGRVYWVILLAELAACSGKAALRYRPRRDAVHRYVVTTRYGREDAPIVAAAATASHGEISAAPGPVSALMARSAAP